MAKNITVGDYVKFTFSGNEYKKEVVEVIERTTFKGRNVSYNLGNGVIIEDSYSTLEVCPKVEVGDVVYHDFNGLIYPCIITDVRKTPGYDCYTYMGKYIEQVGNTRNTLSFSTIGNKRIYLTEKEAEDAEK